MSQVEMIHIFTNTAVDYSLVEGFVNTCGLHLASS